MLSTRFGTLDSIFSKPFNYNYGDSFNCSELHHFMYNPQFLCYELVLLLHLLDLFHTSYIKFI